MDFISINSAFNLKKDTAFAPKPRPSSWRVPLNIKARDSRLFSLPARRCLRYFGKKTSLSPQGDVFFHTHALASLEAARDL
jgi:hypothetical protein